MLSFIIAMTISLSVYFSTGQSGWSVFGAILVFLAVQVISSLLLRKPINAIQGKIQEIIMDGQKRVNAKITQMQQRGNTNIKLMQSIAEQDQKMFLEKALKVVDELEAYCKWSLMMKKQISTMKMQFYFQMKEFDKVDSCMKSAMFLDPMLYCIKMQREYDKDDFKALDKTFRNGRARFRGAKSTMIYATYSWIMVKENRIDEAIEALNLAVKKNTNPVISENLNNLKNGKIKQFSNSKLGESWYALGFEDIKPKVTKARQNVGGKSGRPF